MLVPVAGAFVVGGVAGWLVGGLHDRRRLSKRMERMAESPELSALCIAKDQLLLTAGTAQHFFAKQTLDPRTMFYAKETAAKETALLLGPSAPRRWDASLLRAGGSGAFRPRLRIDCDAGQTSVGSEAGGTGRARSPALGSSEPRCSGSPGHRDWLRVSVV